MTRVAGPVVFEIVQPVFFAILRGIWGHSDAVDLLLQDDQASVAVTDATWWRTIGPPGGLLSILGSLIGKLETDRPTLVPDVGMGRRFVLAIWLQRPARFCDAQGVFAFAGQRRSSESWQVARSKFRRDAATTPLVRV